MFSLSTAIFPAMVSLKIYPSCITAPHWLRQKDGLIFSKRNPDLQKLIRLPAILENVSKEEKSEKKKDIYEDFKTELNNLTDMFSDWNKFIDKEIYYASTNKESKGSLYTEYEFFSKGTMDDNPKNVIGKYFLDVIAKMLELMPGKRLSIDDTLGYFDCLEELETLDEEDLKKAAESFNHNLDELTELCKAKKMKEAESKKDKKGAKKSKGKKILI